MNELETVNKSMAGGRTLEAVTGEIVRLQNNLAMVTVATGIEVGRRLVEAKELVKHGEWGEYIEKNLPFSQTWATRYMRLYNAYGNPQVSLFDEGGNANLAALQNLSVTNALALLALPDGEREQFIEVNDVENMSTRELEKAIKERDEARRAAEEAAKKAETAAADLAAANDLIEELENRPVEVAVQKPSAEEMKRLVDEEVKKVMKNTEDGYRMKQKTADEKIKKLKEELAAKTEEAAGAVKELADLQNAAEAAADAEQLKAELEKTIRERDELKKKANMSTEEIARFKALFDNAQDVMHRVITAVEKASDKKIMASFGNAVFALMDKWDERLNALEASIKKEGGE